MSEFARALLGDLSLSSITPASDESSIWDVLAGTAPSSGAWPTANLAVYIPFRLAKQFVVSQVGWVNGSAAPSGNVDIGVYDYSNARLAHLGSTAASGSASTLQLAALSVMLPPGYYYMSMALDNTTLNNITRWSMGSTTNPVLEALQLQQEASAFALPATATPANPSGTVAVPYFGLFGQATV